MRNTFANIISQIGGKDKDILFLTGDLGFNALEPVRDALGDRFINMGVAEQNMISAAAGFASEGFKVFCYSIAPFIVYRCLEQTRNDVCFHNLPVFLVGNGGGYAYGIMGMTHHAIDDLACLSGLPNMTCYIPSFKDDVESAVQDILKRKSPAYLRLGLGRNKDFKTNDTGFFEGLILNENSHLTILGSGPVLNNIIASLVNNDLIHKVDLFSLTKLPYVNLSGNFIKSILKTKKLLVAEEHISTGSIAEKLSKDILTRGIEIIKFKSLCAEGYPGNVFGSQSFHQKVSGLDTENISKEIKILINGKGFNDK